jgi:hypothetical protein
MFGWTFGSFLGLIPLRAFKELIGNFTAMGLGLTIGAFAVIYGYGGVQADLYKKIAAPPFFIAFLLGMLIHCYATLLRVRSRHKIGFPKIGRLPVMALAFEGPSSMSATETSKPLRSKHFRTIEAFLKKHAETMVSYFFAIICIAIAAISLKEPKIVTYAISYSVVARFVGARD